MKSLLVALSAALVAGTCLSAPTRAAQLDDVLKRLEALEQENSTLRDRVRRLEARKVEPRDAQPAAASARTVVAAAPATAAYNAVPVYKAAPAIPPPSFSWTGVYVGGHVGGGFGTATVNDPFSLFVGTSGTAGDPIRSTHSDGVLGGAQAGWNYQIGQLVVGTEVSLSRADVDGTRIDVLSASSTTLTGTIQTGNDTRTWTGATDWLATGSVRLGYAWDRWMVYTKGGAGVGHFNYTLSDISTTTAVIIPAIPPPVVITSTSSFGIAGHDTRIGWLIGAGVEWAFWNNWSVSVEYNYLDFGVRSVELTGTRTLPTVGGIVTGGFSNTFNIEQNLQVVKLGVNYRFGSAPAAIVAKD